jgi:hypothetical protein
VALGGVALLSLASGWAEGQSCSTRWDDRLAGGDFDGAVLAAARHDPGTGGRWYLGGAFTRASGVPAVGILEWTDGRNYRALGPGLSGGPVRALASFDPDGAGPLPGWLVAGGSFTSAGGGSAAGVAAWDGSAWRPLGDGLALPGGPGQVTALAVFNGELYAGGTFDRSGAVALANLARWTGVSWAPVGAGVPAGVQDLEVADVGGGSALLVGGSFPSVLRWNGAAVSTAFALGGAPTTSLRVNALVPAPGGGVLVLGRFESAAGASANHAALVRPGGADGLFGGVGGGLASGDEASAGAFVEGRPVVAGRFASAGGVQALNIARAGPSGWSAVGEGVEPGARALFFASTGGAETLVVAGDWPGDRRVRRLNQAASRFEPLDAGLWGGGGPARALAVANPGGRLAAPALFVGGDFAGAGPASASLLARLTMERDGPRWSALPAGESPSTPPLVLANLTRKDGDLLLVGGAFRSPCAGLMGLDLSGAPFCFGVIGAPGEEVRALAPIDEITILAGGSFTTPFSGLLVAGVGRAPVRHSAGMVTGSVNTLSLGDFNNDGVRDVFGGGSITQGGIGGPTAPFTLQNGFFIDGVTERMDTRRVNGIFGLGGVVLASTVPPLPYDHTNYMFIGGEFQRAGGITVNNVSPWHGDHWHWMAQGVNGHVRAMTMWDDGSGNGPELYVTGDFTSASGLDTPHIAKWDGTAWAAVPAGGLSGPGHAMAVWDAGDGLGPTLWVAGAFTAAGGRSSQRVARLIGCLGCPGDWDRDGVIDFNDFLAFLNDFTTARPRADLNADGSVDFNDLLAFLNLFNTGC